jgi:hypothetical protein
MFKRPSVLIVVATVFLLGARYWFFREPDGVWKSLKIVQVAFETNEAPPKVIFLLTNEGPIYLYTEMVSLEAKTYRGWITYGETEPADRGLLARQARQFTIKVPPAVGDQPWRLRVTYRYFLSGPELWLSQVRIAMRSRHPGRIMLPGIVGVEPIVSGSTYSVVSMERRL